MVLSAVVLKIQPFWDLALCRFNILRRLNDHSGFIRLGHSHFFNMTMIFTEARIFLRIKSLDSNDGGDRFLLNICNYLPVLNLGETS